MSLEEVLTIFEQLAHALGQAHELGIIHRDLKPENLFMARPRRKSGPPTLKILDFGIATFIDSNRTAATATTAIGSPLWLAPEQAGTGAKLRPSVDVWALGLIAFYLLTGKSYWQAANGDTFSLSALLAEVLVHPIVSASERARELDVTDRIPDGFDEFFGDCVCRDPGDRLIDANQVVDRLAALPEGTRSTLLDDLESATGHASMQVLPTLPSVKKTVLLSSGQLPTEPSLGARAAVRIAEGMRSLSAPHLLVAAMVLLAVIASVASWLLRR